MADNTQPIDYANIRITSMLEAITAQRNNALNEIANLVAENAVLKAALGSQTVKISELEKQLDSKSSFETS